MAEDSYEIKLKRIELKNATFTKDILDGVTFFQFAETGAMGEPGGIVFLTGDNKLYHANYFFGDLTMETIKKAFPPLAKCEFGLGIRTVVPKGWEYVNLGMGNHLIVRSDYYAKFALMITGFNSCGELYMHWLEKALSIR